MRKFVALVCIMLVGSFVFAAPPDYPMRANLVPRPVDGVRPSLGDAGHWWGPSYVVMLYVGPVNNYQAYLSYFDSTGNFHVGEPFVIGPYGPNRKKTIIDPGNQYDFEINVSGVSGGNYPFNIYCSEGDTAYYWSIYNQYGAAPVIQSSYPLHFYGTKNLTPVLEREWKIVAVYDSLGKLRVSIEDTANLSPIKVYDMSGALAAIFGARCSTTTVEAAVSISSPKIKSSGIQTAGKITYSSNQRIATYISGLNANCIVTAIGDSTMAANQAGTIDIGAFCKTDSLITFATASISGVINYIIVWFNP